MLIYRAVSYRINDCCSTYVLQACDVLSKPQRSLAYLLETYCDVAANKLLQVFSCKYNLIYLAVLFP